MDLRKMLYKFKEPLVVSKINLSNILTFELSENQLCVPYFEG